MAAGIRRGRGWEALAAAAAVNLLAVVMLDEIAFGVDEPDRSHLAAATAAAAPLPGAPIAFDPLAAPSLSNVGLITVSPPALPLEAILGVGDSAPPTGRAPVRPTSTDLPGEQAADRGGGGTGGTATWTERRDRASDAALRSRIWNSPDAYRTPRQGGDRRAASTEAIHRAPERTYGDRAAATRALDGAPAASTGDARGTGRDGIPIPAAAAHDATAGAAGATTPARVDGATRANREAAFVDPGARAVDVARKGAPADDRAVAGASDQRRVDPFDLTPPRSGGAHDGEDVAGPVPSPGVLADGWGRGTSASRAPTPDGTGGAATFATRQDPYFVELFRRLDRMIEYPRDLRIRMISGRVVALVTLRADGRVTDVSIHAGSGHASFDDALAGALREIGKLGPVPRPLLEGRGELRVMIPYTFRSPMIR